MNMKRFSIALVHLAGSVLLLACVSGCSTFNQDWKQAAVRPVAAVDGLAGRWEGHWLSDVNGHTGRLRCEYEFHYWATFWKIFRYSYAVHLHVQKTGEEYEFKGEEDLGKMAGGVYQYEGKVVGTKFSSTYKSSVDHGTFSLTRVE